MKAALGSLLLLLAALFSVACGGPDFSYFESITSGSNPGSTLILVWLSDSPIDAAEEVKITIERVELIGTDGAVLLSDERRTWDLLDLQNGKRVQLAEENVPAGQYQRLRLTLATALGQAPTIRVDGVVHPLAFHRLGAHVVEVTYPFHAPADERTEIQLDFNVRLSVSQVGEAWQLAPTVEAVDPNAVGAVAGRITGEFGIPIAGATVVAYRDGFEIRSTRSAPDGTYHIGLLPAGTYRIDLLAQPGASQEVPHLPVVTGVTTALDFTD